MTIEIIKNAPIPDAKFNPQYADTIRAMDIGDSVILKTPKEAKSFAQALRNAGFAQVTRKVEGGLQVWKKQMPAK